DRNVTGVQTCALPISKMAEKILEQQRSQGFTSDKAKGWVGGTRLLLPVALPLAYRAMTWVQNRNHDADARKFGVSGDAAARYHRSEERRVGKEDGSAA